MTDDTGRKEGYRCTFLVYDPEENEQVECGHVEDNWYDIRLHFRLKHDAAEHYSEFTTPVSLPNEGSVQPESECNTRSEDTGADQEDRR